MVTSRHHWVIWPSLWIIIVVLVALIVGNLTIILGHLFIIVSPPLEAFFSDFLVIQTLRHTHSTSSRRIEVGGVFKTQSPHYQPTITLSSQYHYLNLTSLSRFPYVTLTSSPDHLTITSLTRVGERTIRSRFVPETWAEVGDLQCTMVENGKKHRQNSHLIIHFLTSERCERTSERTSEWPSTSVCILGCYRP